MMSNKIQKIMLLSLGIALVLFSGVNSFAAVEFNVEAIDAEIAAAVANGVEPVIAAKSAVANAVREVVAANAEYPGGPDALNQAILDALGGLTITGLDTVDVLVAGNHALELQVDTALEAYEAGGGPGNAGRVNARNRGGNAYGPGGKPQPGSPT